jgi:peptidoglycan hydrolase-like protein with peptidoglycan-binding domain
MRPWVAVAIVAACLHSEASAVAQSSTGHFGPSFSCAKASDPVGATICFDDRLPEIDLAYVQAFQALRQQLGEDQRAALRQDAIQFWRSVIDQCGLPQSGVPDNDTMRRAASCIAQLYQQQRSVYLGQLRRDASEEAQRDLPAHIQLQGQLALLGYLPVQPPADGVYGPATRAAIGRFQADHGLLQTGLMTDETAGAIVQGASASIAGTPNPSGPGNNPLAPAGTPITVPGGRDQMQFRAYRPMQAVAIFGNAWHIYADGVLDADAATRLDKLITDNDIPSGSTFILNSPGGSLLGGMKLGRTIREKGLLTYVGRDAGAPPTQWDLASVTALAAWPFSAGNIGTSTPSQRMGFTGFIPTRREIRMQTSRKSYRLPWCNTFAIWMSIQNYLA